LIFSSNVEFSGGAWRTFFDAIRFAGGPAADNRTGKEKSKGNSGVEKRARLPFLRQVKKAPSTAGDMRGARTRRGAIRLSGGERWPIITGLGAY